METSIKSGKKRNLRIASLLLIIVIFFLVVDANYLCLEEMKDFCESLQSRLIMYGFSALFMILCAISPLPAEAVVLLNATVYSSVEAFWVSWLSAIIAAQLAYEMGRIFPLEFHSKWYGAIENICRKMQSQRYKALLIMRLVPLVPFFLLNLMSGLLLLNRYKYFVITSMAILPAVLVMTALPQILK